MKDFKIDTHPKIKSLYDADDAYLEDFQQRIALAARSEVGKTAAKSRWIRSNLRYMAAAVLIAALCLPFVIQTTTKVEVSATEIEQELLRNVDFGSVAFALDTDLSANFSDDVSQNSDLENELLENTNVEFLITEQ